MILGTLLWLGVSRFLVEASRIALVGRPGFESWTLVGWPLSSVVGGWSRADLSDLHRWLWVLHVGGFVAFLLILPTTKTTPASSAAITTCTSPPDGWSDRSAASRWWRCRATGTARSAAARGAPASGWRNGWARRSASSGSRRPSGATRLAVACPFCHVMLDDSLKETGRDTEIEVVDIATLLLRALPDTTPAGGAEDLGGA
jgi:hypothetical protein